MQPSRPLTHDEKKASEAAFQGMPFNPSWSIGARAVYDGIVEAIKKAPNIFLPEATPPPHDAATPVSLSPGKTELSSSDLPDWMERLNPSGGPSGSPQTVQIRLRREAIDAGIIKEVSSVAHSLGMGLRVGITKPLWDKYIAASLDFSEEELTARVKDVVMAVRLRLATMKNPVALIEVPAVLSWPPNPTPQLFSLLALFHNDPSDGDCLLLLHAGEVFMTKQQFLNN